MIRLKDDIRKNGFSYKLYKRSNSAAIYKQYFEDRVVGYEVFKIKIKKKGKVWGREYEEHEIFPNNEAFGFWAWSWGVNQKDQALANFDELTKEKVEKIKETFVFGEYEIIRYKKNNNIIVMKDGAPFSRPKLILVAATMVYYKIPMEEAMQYKMIDLADKIFNYGGEICQRKPE